MWSRFLATWTTVGLTLATLYSGMLTPEIDKGFAMQCLQEKHGVKAKLATAFAADSVDGPEISLEHTLPADRPKHFYRDINDFVYEEAKEVLD